MNVGYTAPGERRAGSVVLAQQPSVYSSSYQVSAGYSVSGARLLGTRLAREEGRATAARVAGHEAVLANEVTQRYVAALQAAEQVELAAREVARTSEHLRSARDRMAGGQLTPLEVRRAEVQVGRAEIRGVRAANAYATALLGLGRSMGGHVDPAVRLSTRLEVFDPPWQAPDLVRRALAYNAGLNVSAASVAAAATRVRVARAGYYPTLALSVGVNGWKQMSDEDAMVSNRLGGGQHDSATVSRVRQEVRAQNAGFPFAYNRQPLAATLSVQVPVFQGSGRAQQLRQARAQAEDARLHLRAEELRVEQEVTTAFLELTAARDASVVAARVRALAAEEVEMARERFRVGLSNSLAVLDAQTHLSEAEQEQTTAAFDFHRALARLESLVGEPLC
jgi:outer membrane protein